MGVYEMEHIFKEIKKERERQDLKWEVNRIRNLDWRLWCTILGEEYGEVCRAVLEKDFENLEEELVQVAAVCVAMLEDLKNRKENGELK
jgi:NTP pyrophosphatase (non-canonical NTP hydrolase)